MRARVCGGGSSCIQFEGEGVMYTRLEHLYRLFIAASLFKRCTVV